MELLRFEEAEPDVYPTLTFQPSPESYPEYHESEEPYDPQPVQLVAAYWRRIELWIDRRWTPRQCVWTVRGPGNWKPHLSPVSNIVIDEWDETGYVWNASTLNPSPLGGYELPFRGTYRITATVGGTTEPVPEPVVMAYLRLKAYYEDGRSREGIAGAASETLNLGGEIEETVQRSPNWLAKALQHSGCADLLRQYRRPH